MVSKKKVSVKGKPTFVGNNNSKIFEKQIKDLSEQELKELLLINMYKLALTRAQLEAITNVLIKNKMATLDEIWKETNENFKNSV
jgi:ribosomal protein L20A (L18A)